MIRGALNGGVTKGQQLAWRALNEAYASYLMSTRLDFACWLEQTGAPPPVSFNTVANLRDWCKNIGHMKIEPFGRLSGALRVHGALHAGWYYDQIWTDKRYSGYRRLMLKHAIDGFDVNPKDLSGVDADHVVARNLLKRMPKAWVAVFPVPANANRGFGRIESHLPKFAPNKNTISLTPITAFKLFCTHLPRNGTELALAMRDIRGQIMNNDINVVRFVDAMEKDIRRFLN